MFRRCVLILILGVASSVAMPKEEEEKEEVIVKQVEPIKFVSIARTGDYSQAHEVFEQLYRWLNERKLEPAGPAFGIYYDNPKEVPPDSCRYEGCIPIEAEVEGDSLVQVKGLDKMEVASLIHKGSYKNIGPAWERLYSWVSTNRYEPAGAWMEVYLNSPKEVPEDSLLTELRIPIKKKGIKVIPSKRGESG